MQTIHHPPTGESIIGHGGENCPCGPRRTTQHTRRSHRQGFEVTEHYWHNPMSTTPDEGEEEEPVERDIWDEADDAYAEYKEDPSNW